MLLGWLINFQFLAKSLYPVNISFQGAAAKLSYFFRVWFFKFQLGCFFHFLMSTSQNYTKTIICLRLSKFYFAFSKELLIIIEFQDFFTPPPSFFTSGPLRHDFMCILTSSSFECAKSI